MLTFIRLAKSLSKKLVLRFGVVRQSHQYTLTLLVTFLRNNFHVILSL